MNMEIELFNGVKLNLHQKSNMQIVELYSRVFSITTIHDSTAFQAIYVIQVNEHENSWATYWMESTHNRVCFF